LSKLHIRGEEDLVPYSEAEIIPFVKRIPDLEEEAQENAKNAQEGDPSLSGKHR